MGDGEFCVVCGRTDLPLEDGVCPECSAQRTKLVWFTGHPSVEVCASCGARKVGQHWDRRGASPSLLTGDDLTPLLSVHPDVGIRRVLWSEVASGPVQRVYLGEADLRFRGTERKVSIEMPVRLRAVTCPECSRRTGHFYTAVIQVRGTSERLRGSSAELRERLEVAFESILKETKKEWREAFSWREPLPEGWDYYLLNTLAARSVARFAKARLGATLKESATLWGRKNGKDVYRVTFCLRVPDRAAPLPK
ncbi:MAG: 60S ribosomal export protein NMD3 [Thermoplasmata archaeon]|nr:60S ribosomal export protein NMD3 [Thermoplasmata archaeon]